MQFILGFISGLAIGVMVFVILAYFRAGIEKRVRIIETKLGNAGPKVKGAIFMPDSDADAARKKLIAENQKVGKDTRFEDL